ncbi:rhomboid family intramembrane serine protease [Desulfuromonas acetexigens]|nr:rhomboid family intramembrane serine protease [Desulfuromonas acetexigens]
MLLPVGDTPNPPGIPYATYLLIGLNVAVFLLIAVPLSGTRPELADPLLHEYLRVAGAKTPQAARILFQQLSAYDLYVFRHGFRPGSPDLSTLFSAMFLHGGWMHLFGNMLFLYIFGDNVEHRLGRFRFLLAYLGMGVLSTLFFALFVPSSQVPLVGASGAISGVLGCYYLWFPRNQIKIFVFLFPLLVTTFLVPARLVLGFYLLVDNLLPFLLDAGGNGGVAHGAHIGGFIAGLAIAWGLDRAPERRWRRGSEVAAGAGGDPGENLRQALVGDDLALADALYRQLGDRQARARLASETWLDLGEFYLTHRRFDPALGLFRRFIAERPADPGLDRAYLGAGKALIHQPRCITSAYHYFLAALDLARTPERAEEARLHLRGIERLGGKGPGTRQEKC